MKHGDISNHRGFVIGFRCEDCLLEFKEKGVINKVTNLIKGKAHNAEVNKKVLSMMNHIYWDTEMTVSLVVDKKNYTKELEEYVSSFPFNQVGLIFTSISEVTMLLNTGQMSYYIDTDEARISDVNSRYAVTPDEFSKILKRGMHIGKEDKTL